MTDKIKEYLASIGSKGGKATGKAKVRGDSDYYKRISAKAAEARKAKSDDFDYYSILPGGLKKSPTARKAKRATDSAAVKESKK